MRTLRVCDGAREILAAANEEARRFEEANWDPFTASDDELDEYDSFRRRLDEEARLEREREERYAAAAEASYDPEPYGDEPPY